MKKLITILTLFIFASCGQRTAIKPFKLTIYNSDYSLAYTLKYVLTDRDLQITFKGEIAGEKDSTLFTVALKPSYALHKLSNINVSSLQEYYENPCIRDGSQIIVEFDKDYKNKTIQLSNFYQKDIGLAIEFINSSTPKRYKIWYDKTTLLKGQQDCK
ncbi:hypothetical protein IWX76_001307 [Pedobacter sp. CAN_A7]|uniref:hypothetical protein n=1 Tax=Pedobacter sp. CAN_A7 TaxID=2787722 RepID=UPI0018CB3A6B